MHALHPPAQELCRPLQAELLHLFGAESRHAYFRDPNWLVGDAAYVLHARRPLVDWPVVPIEREAVRGHDVDFVEHPLRPHIFEKSWVNRRNSAEHTLSREFSERTASAASFTISAKRRQPLSSSKSQCDALLGSFQSITALGRVSSICGDPKGT